MSEIDKKFIEIISVYYPYAFADVKGVYLRVDKSVDATKSILESAMEHGMSLESMIDAYLLELKLQDKNVTK